LRLLRTSLGRASYRRENTALRDAARRFTGVRDAKVLVDTVEGLAEGTPAAERRALRIERARLLDQREKVRRRLERNRAALTSARRSISLAHRRISRWKPDAQGWSVLGSGVRRVYRTGRRAFRAVQSSPSTENLHELRKQAKYLWHVLEILEPVSASARKPEGRARRLSRCLGEDHDLAVLVGRLRRRRDQSPGTEAILRLARRRQARLQSEALALSARLFRDKPSEFAKRLARRRDRT
jgi:CHAD domain-containing protein